MNEPTFDWIWDGFDGGTVSSEPTEPLTFEKLLEIKRRLDEETKNCKHPIFVQHRIPRRKNHRIRSRWARNINNYRIEWR